jgi:hypothetical protein
MKPILRIALAATLTMPAACATGPNSPSGERAATVTRAVDQLHAAQADAGKGDSSKLAQLAALLPALQAVIDTDPNDDASTAAYYYRGEIAFAINSDRYRQGSPLDPQMTAVAWDGFGKVYTGQRVAPAWHVDYGNAAFRMGNTAYIAGDYDAARHSFEICAELGHAGCINSLADLLLRGSPPGDSDLAASFQLFRSTAATGTSGTCAGSFSAGTVAEFIHFKVTPEATGNALDRLTQARDLAKQAETIVGHRNACHAPINDIWEYLMRADDGEVKPAILEAVMLNADEPMDRALAEHLLGRIDETELARRLESPQLAPSQRCDIEFALLWNASRLGDRNSARRHFAALAALPPLTCLQERVFARNLGYSS